MKRILAVGLFSLIVVGIVDSSLSAQRSPGFPRPASGGDLMLRVDGVGIDGKAWGTWMVRIDGEWHELGGRGGLFPAAPARP